MIKFFRKMRQRLLTENKFSKYLLYATGEMILVVIGILIALQINDWNEERKINSKSYNYLQRLQEDMNTNIAEADLYINNTERKQKYSTVVLDALEAHELSTSQKEDFDRYLKVYYQFYITISDFNTVNEMTSSGDLGLIKNQWLRSEFSNLASTREFIMEVNQSNHDAYKINIDLFQKHIRYRVENIDTDSIAVSAAYDFQAMANDVAFVNQISSQSVNWYDIAGMYKYYKTSLTTVKDTIEVELKKHEK
jgi:hypothetical protein